MCRAIAWWRNSSGPNVAADLPAKAVCQATWMLTGTASSRASSLPQDLLCGAQIFPGRVPRGSELARERPASPYPANRAANALACNATSVTAVLSHHIPRSGGPMPNKRLATCPSASSTAPSTAAVIPNANGPGRTSPRASNCCGNGRATRRQSYSMPLELISAAPCTTRVSDSPRGRMRMLTPCCVLGSSPLNDAA